MTDFRARADAFLSEFLALQPTAATRIGEHAYDALARHVGGRTARRIGRPLAGRVPRVHGPVRRRRRRPRSARPAAGRDALRDVDLREEAWSPLDWVYLLGGGLFGLVSRNSRRWRSGSPRSPGRLDGIEAVVDAAIEEIGPVGERPVARFHTEKASSSATGLAAEATAAQQAEAIRPSCCHVAPPPSVRGLQMDRLERLRDEVLPRRRRRCGRLFAEKMRHTMRSDELTLSGSSNRRSATTTSCAPRWSSRHGAVADLVPGHRTPADEQRLVRGVLDAIAADHLPSESCSTSAARSSSGSRRSAASAT